MLYDTKINSRVLLTEDYGALKKGDTGFIGYRVYGDLNPTKTVGIKIHNKLNNRSKLGLFWIPANLLINIKDEESIIKEEDFTMSANMSQRGCCEARTIKTAKNEGVLNAYISKEANKIFKEYTEEKKNLYQKDKNLLSISATLESIFDTNDQLQEAKLKRAKENIINGSSYLLITKETEYEIKILDEIQQEKIKNLEEKENEINVLLMGCETYEQEINVLKGYGIVNADENGIRLNF